jgi:hypothetical protein
MIKIKGEQFMAEKHLNTRIVHKHDLEVYWNKAENFVPMQGELIIYDIEVDEHGNVLKIPDGNGGNIDVLPRDKDGNKLRTEPYTYERFKIGDGKRIPKDLPFANSITNSTEQDVQLAEDLYTYTAIGKITSASNTNPVKVADAGQSLKTVFNKIFGEAADATPNISNNSSLTATGGDSYSGGEYGTAISAKTVTATFTLANTGTAQYGYKCGDTTYTTSNKTFYYPITLQSGAQIKLALPKTISKVEDTTVNSVAYKKITHTADSDSTTVTVLVQKDLYKSYSGSNLYCNLSDNSISLTINLPAKTATTSQQTRYGAISASVQLGSPQDDNGNTITKFLTYFEQQGKTAAVSAQSPTAAGEKTNSTSAYTISAGSYYKYYLASTSTSLSSDVKNPVTGATKFSSTTVSINCTNASHIWFLLPPDTSGSKSIQYEPFANTWVDAFGGATDTTLGPIDVALKLDSSPKTGDPVVVMYKGYYTSAKAAAGSELNYKIV